MRNSGVYEYSALEEIVDIRLGSVGVFVIEVGILSIKEMQEVRVPMNLPAGRNLHYASKSLRELIILSKIRKSWQKKSIFMSCLIVITDNGSTSG